MAFPAGARYPPPGASQRVLPWAVEVEHDLRTRSGVLLAQLFDRRAHGAGFGAREYSRTLGTSSLFIDAVRQSASGAYSLTASVAAAQWQADSWRLEPLDLADQQPKRFSTSRAPLLPAWIAVGPSQGNRGLPEAEDFC
jgi:hypothetical protein